MVTVRCGHCANLLSVNMAASLQAVPPQDTQVNIYINRSDSFGLLSPGYFLPILGGLNLYNNGHKYKTKRSLVLSRNELDSPYILHCAPSKIIISLSFSDSNIYIYILITLLN